MLVESASSSADRFRESAKMLLSNVGIETSEYTSPVFGFMTTAEAIVAGPQTPLVSAIDSCNSSATYCWRPMSMASSRLFPGTGSFVPIWLMSRPWASCSAAL